MQIAARATAFRPGFRIAFLDMNWPFNMRCLSVLYNNESDTLNQKGKEACCQRNAASCRERGFQMDAAVCCKGSKLKRLRSYQSVDRHHMSAKNGAGKWLKN